MIYTIGTRKLNIPETGDTRKIRTPRQVVPYRDVAETCRTIDALLPGIPIPKGRPLRIVDGVARSGFWGGVFLSRWPDCGLILNETDSACIDILKTNFPEHQIESNDIYSWTPPPSDILLLDFDDFTLRKSAKHKEVLRRIAPTTKNLLVADNTCFGFKFGNLKHYGVTTEEQYYEKLNAEMLDCLGGKRMVAVSAFLNAAMIYYCDVPDSPITYIPPSPLPISRGGVVYGKKPQKAPGKGFGFL